MKSQPLLIRILMITAVIFAIFAINSYVHLFQFPEKIYSQYLFFAVFMQIIYWLVSSFCWKQTLFASSATSIPLRKSFFQVLTVQFGKYIPGKIWGIAARSYQLSLSNINYAQSSHATILEQILMAHTGALCGLYGWILIFKPSLRWVVVLLAFGSLILIPKFYEQLLLWSTALYQRVKHRKVASDHRSISTSGYFKLFSIYLLDWLSLGCVELFIYLALFNQTLTADFTILLLSANAFGVIAGFFVFFIPGGIGVRESVTAGILSFIIPITDAALLVIVFRLWLICAELIAGAIYLLINRHRSIVKQENDLTHL